VDEECGNIADCDKPDVPFDICFHFLKGGHPYYHLFFYPDTSSVARLSNRPVLFNIRPDYDDAVFAAPPADRLKISFTDCAYVSGAPNRVSMDSAGLKREYQQTGNFLSVFKRTELCGTMTKKTLNKW
jgi:hypothetical protein